MKSQESIKAFVKKVDGAIGYIESSALDEDLKVIYRWKD
jgi:ABC-type phosphate transport system substrate-binding protein